MNGFTLDTGALIALERGKQRMVALLRRARRFGSSVIAPAPVVAEWWRKRSDLCEGILDAVSVEPMDRELAKIVGETLAAEPRASLVDAAVMASAAQRGDIVLTSDIGDLERLRARFPGVRLLRV